jgi:arylsulfatase A-like enzyme
MIWIFGDQHRAQAQGHMGDPNVRTPNLDGLAEEGVTFVQAVAGCPWCTPFRGSLLTSRYVHNTTPATPSALDPSLPTVAQPFNEAGYDTAYFGKWHLDGPKKGQPPHTRIVPRERRGSFNTWIGFENNNNPQYTYVHGHRGEQEVEQYMLDDFETDALSDLLIHYVNDRADDRKPFFAVLSVQPPHCPYHTAPEEFARRHNAGNVQLRPNVPDIPAVQQEARRDLAGYYALIENLDWNVGRIKAALRKSGLIDNTHIMFFADHGDMHGSHGRWQKSTPWEESIRIPFIMSGMRPHTKHTGMMRTDAVINHVDIAPTSLGLCGIDVPDWMLGYDYSAYRTPGVAKSELPRPGEPDSAYLQHCVRKMHRGCMDRTWRGIVTRDGWKYVVSDRFPYLMFNLREDPYEQDNLALDPEFAPKRKELQARLEQWTRDVDDPYPMPEL